MPKNEFRVVVYKNGYPTDKVEFVHAEDAENFRDMMIDRRAQERARGLWKGVSWHYVAEYNN